MKPTRRTFAILLLVAASAFTLYLNLPNYLSGAIAAQLKTYGFDDVTYDSSFPRLDGLDLHTIEFSYHSGGVQVSGEIQSLAVTYGASGLRERRVDAIEIKDATLTITTTDPAESMPPEAAPGKSLAESLKSLPFHELNLVNVKLTLPDALAGELGTVVLNGRYLKDELLTLDVSGDLKDHGPLIAVFKGKLLEKSVTGDALISKQAGDKLLSGKVDYELQSETLRASLKLLPAALPFPVTALSATVSYRDRVLDIEKALANVFAGEITTKQSKIAFKTNKWSLPLKVQGINLEQLLKDYPQEKVSGTGILDGEFVLSHDSRGFSVQKGVADSRAPGGTLSYHAPELDNPESGLPSELQVLKNFNYDSLKSPFTLEPDGVLRLNIELSGNSPDWQSGKRVNLNLNIEENLYDLIKSIRLTQGQGLNTEEIDKAIKGRNR